jgi:hypothetical protein
MRATVTIQFHPDGPEQKVPPPSELEFEQIEISMKQHVKKVPGKDVVGIKLGNKYAVIHGWLSDPQNTCGKTYDPEIKAEKIGPHTLKLTESVCQKNDS